MSWDSGGIPVSSLSSEVMVTEQKMDWKNMKLEFGDGGSATGSGQLDLDRNAQDEPATLYDRLTGLSTIFEVKRLNLLRIDSRLKPTELNGQIQAAGVNTGLEISLNLKDSRRDNLNGKLEAQVHVNPEEVVSLKKIELRAKDAVLTAQGSFSLRNKQVFNLQGEAKNLNPALWIDVPEGHIGTRFNIKGQLKQGWLVDAQITDFSGQFAGLNLHGESNIVAEQDKSVSVKNCEFKWGKNHIYAKGYWPLAVLTSSPQQNQLHFSVALPDLGEFSKPFKKIMPSAIQENFHGALFIDGILSGNAKQPGGHLTVKASNLSVPGIVGFDKLQAAIDLESGKQGKISGNLDASELSIGSLLESPGASSEPSMKREYEGLKFSRVKVNLSGLRHAHQLSLNADWLHKYQIALQAKGELQESGPSLDNAARWRGSVEQLDLTGPSDLKLVSPFSLQISENSTEMGAANWQGKLGKLQIQQMLWSHNRLKTKGQLQNLSVVNLHKLWRAKLPLMGNLQLYAGWDLDIGQKQAEGQFDVRRESGDLIVQDVSSGLSQIFALGLQKLLVTAKLGHTPVSESDINKKVFSLLRQPVDVQVHVQGSQLGSIDGHVSTSANKTAQGWDVNAPLSGAASMHLNDIQWLSQLVGSGAADVALRGEVELNAQLAGTIQNPTYLAKISGKEVQVTLAELGVLLPHGVLKASIEESSGKTKFTLDKLRFSHAIKLPAMAGAKHDELAKLPWLEEKGFIEASGEIDLQSGHGAIAAHWQRFPFLQDSNHWLVASGDAQLTQTEKAWQLTGQLSADAAYFSMPKEAPPKLSSDVVVLKKKDRTQAKSINQANLKSSVDFIIKTGNNFVFVGRGLDTRLTGQLRVRLQDDDPMFVTGLIQTSGGTYEGYGQQLAIERGNLNFQGAPDNPSLNVRALRRGLRVEAGVEVIGTVAKPEVRLISEPEVPDQDKLSWMMLGRSSDQMAGSEASLLMSAASAIFGGDSGSDVPRELARTFGLDDISIGTSTGSRESQLPSQTVAGNISNVTSNEQIFSIGKRLSPNLVFSIERSLTDATNGITLTWNLTRRFSIVGRAGNDTSIDGQYMFSFN
jgi:translocation and assembly module TamB